MWSFLKAVVAISLLAVVAFYGSRFLSKAISGGYSPSDDVLNAAEISKNPYKFKGMSGIMNPSTIRFSNMAGEQTAIYESAFIYSSDQLAVEMPDNEPPSTNRWWRVYVEGTMDGTNGFGAPVTIGEVRFEGYAEPPPQPVTDPNPVPAVQPAIPQPEPYNLSTSPSDGPSQSRDESSPSGEQPPAPIVRQPPEASPPQ